MPASLSAEGLPRRARRHGRPHGSADLLAGTHGDVSKAGYPAGLFERVTTRPFYPITARSLAPVCQTMDGAVGVAALLLVLAVHPWADAPDSSVVLSTRVSLGTALLLSFAVLSWPWLMAGFGLYHFSELKHGLIEFDRIAKACAVASGVGAVVALTVAGPATARDGALAFWVAATVGTACGRAAIRRTLRGGIGSRVDVRRIIIAGTGPRAMDSYRAFAADHSFKVLGFVDKTAGAAPRIHVPGAPFLGTIAKLEEILASQPVDAVHIRLPVRSCYEAIEQILATCERLGVESCYDADIFAASRARPVMNSPALVVTRKVVTDDYRLSVKRLIDIAGSLAGLIVCSPVILVAALLVRVTSHGPAFFVQERVGFRLRRLKVYKLRTMVADAEDRQSELEHENEKDGPIFKMQNDPRVTRLGRILRKTSIDELPQLVNVLRGEMSLVGPRPMALRDVALFPQPSLVRRFSVKPGLTGLWQVSGRSQTSFARLIELDFEYIDRWSLALDLRILAKTLPIVVRGEGAS